jgi:hypothetical protein
MNSLSFLLPATYRWPSLQSFKLAGGTLNVQSLTPDVASGIAEALRTSAARVHTMQSSLTRSGEGYLAIEGQDVECSCIFTALEPLCGTSLARTVQGLGLVGCKCDDPFIARVFPEVCTLGLFEAAPLKGWLAPVAQLLPCLKDAQVRARPCSCRYRRGAGGVQGNPGIITL